MILLILLFVYLTLVASFIISAAIMIYIKTTEENSKPKRGSVWIDDTEVVVRVETTIINVWFEQYSFSQDLWMFDSESGMPVQEFCDRFTELKDPEEEIERIKGLKLLQALD